MSSFRHATVVATFLSLAAAAHAQQPGSHFLENWDLDASGDVSLAELEERRGDVFAAFDANDDGALDASEYDIFDEARRADMESQPGHGKGLAHVMTGLQRDANDTDGDGLVTRDEFIAASATWFQSLDRNGDGAVTTADFGRK
ncbi:MAG: hypothetical protein R3C97_12595 [Geminicoccaceae bacterium]